MYIVFVLDFYTVVSLLLKCHFKMSSGNAFKPEQKNRWTTFKPGLTFISFRTIRPCLWKLPYVSLTSNISYSSPFSHKIISIFQNLLLFNHLKITIQHRIYLPDNFYTTKSKQTKKTKKQNKKATKKFSDFARKNFELRCIKPWSVS